MRRFGDPSGRRGCPGPAQPCKRSGGCPGVFAFGPVRFFEMREQRARSLKQHRRRALIIGRNIEAKRRGKTLGRRHHEGRRVHEGEEFEQVEPRQFGIAEPLSDERRVQQYHRGFGGLRDRLTAPDTPYAPVGRGDPDTGMACMKGRIG